MANNLYICDSGYSTVPHGIIDGNYKCCYQNINAMYYYIEYNGSKILFDTGYDMNFVEINTWYSALFKKIVYFGKEQLNTQKKPYIDDEIDIVIISHYHPDHIGGLKRFKNANFIAWDVPNTGLLSGFLPDLLPNNFYKRLTIVKNTTELYLGKSNTLATFGKPKYNIFENDNNLILVLLSGHCNLHCGLLINNKVFLVADSVWTRKTFREFAYPSLITNLIQESTTKYYKTIKYLHNLHRTTSIDIIPSHCPEISKLLNGQSFLKLNVQLNNATTNTIKTYAKILVTGASGFLGKAVVEYLISDKYAVVGCGRKNMDTDTNNYNHNYKYYQFDISDPIQVNNYVDIIQPDAIIHCAALCTPWDTWDNYYKSNVIGTKNLLESALKYNVKRFIHVSSPSIYFNNLKMYGTNDILENEKIQTSFQSYYNRSKLLAEYEVMKILSNCQMETIIVRPRGIYGKNDQTIMPILIKKLPYIPYLGDNKIDLTHIDNVVVALYLCLKCDSSKCGTSYNITDGVSYNSDKIMNDIANKKNITRKIMYPMHWQHFPLILNIYKTILFIIIFVYETICKLLYNYVSHSVIFKPLITTYTFSLLAYDSTFDIQKARTHLGYNPTVHNIIDNV